MAMTKYYWRNGRHEDAYGNPMPLPHKGAICAPFLVKPMPEYSSPIDGRPITTRHERREDMKRNGCVEYEPSMVKADRVLTNERFAAKHGFQVGEKLQDAG